MHFYKTCICFIYLLRLYDSLLAYAYIIMWFYIERKNEYVRPSEGLKRNIEKQEQTGANRGEVISRDKDQQAVWLDSSYVKGW